MTSPLPSAPSLVSAQSSGHRATARSGRRDAALRVAIVGAGPAGSALGILLAEQGAEVTLLDDGRRPPLIVGESLIPAVVPLLRRLGMEEDTASFSPRKPGV